MRMLTGSYPQSLFPMNRKELDTAVEKVGGFKGVVFDFRPKTPLYDHGIDPSAAMQALNA